MQQTIQHATNKVHMVTIGIVLTTSIIGLIAAIVEHKWQVATFAFSSTAMAATSLALLLALDRANARAQEAHEEAEAAVDAGLAFVDKVRPMLEELDRLAKSNPTTNPTEECHSTSP